MGLEPEKILKYALTGRGAIMGSDNILSSCVGGG